MGSSLVAAVVSAAWVIGLALAQYPPWRVVGAGALFAVITVTNIVAARDRRRSFVPWVPLVGLLAIASITGGLRSPFFFAVMGPLLVLPSMLPWRGLMAAAVALVAGGALAISLMPAAWRGPTVSDPAWTVMTVLTVLTVMTIATSHAAGVNRTLHASRCEIDRSNELMAHQAFSRARELEQMSAQLSHELKNPLGAIKTLVQLSARDVTDAKSRERLRVAETEIERMNCILKEYLSFTRPFEKLRSEPVDLGALVDEVLQLLGPGAATSGVSLRREGEARVEVDPRRLREALVNLVANALEATPRGGSVEVAIAERSLAVEVAVRDSGRGMPPEVLEKVGTPFFTTREQGTGLGVVLARAAFVQHGGALQYTSAEGRGTIATGILPLPRRENGAPAPRG
jgi:signal transduction histidine kinase